MIADRLSWINHRGSLFFLDGGSMIPDRSYWIDHHGSALVNEYLKWCMCTFVDPVTTTGPIVHVVARNEIPSEIHRFGGRWKLLSLRFQLS